MSLMPFLDELTESRYFQDQNSVKGRSADQLAETLMIMTLMLEVLRHSDSDFTRGYADRTLTYSEHNFDKMLYSATDFYNIAAVLANQKLYEDKIRTNYSINIPVYQLKRYLTNLRNKNIHYRNDRQFLMEMEDYLRVSKFKQLRRIIGDWQDAEKWEKNLSYYTIKRELHNNANQCDLYHSYKQYFEDR